MARSKRTKSLRGALNRATNIKGIGKLEKALTKLGEAAGAAAVDVLVDAGRVTKREVLSRTPLGPTGNLRRSIFLDARDPFHDPKGPSVLVGINHNIAPHWHFLELGTSRQGARPFFRPGVQASKKQVQAIITNGLKGIVEGKV